MNLITPFQNSSHHAQDILKTRNLNESPTLVQTKLTSVTLKDFGNADEITHSLYALHC